MFVNQSFDNVSRGESIRVSVRWQFLINIVVRDRALTPHFGTAVRDRDHDSLSQHQMQVGIANMQIILWASPCVSEPGFTYPLTMAASITQSSRYSARLGGAQVSW